MSCQTLTASQCEVTSRKYALKQENRIGVRFIKYDRYTRCILKMCRSFTYEIVGQRRRLKAVKKNFTSKIKCQFIF
jgi:hypothetical protein